MKSITTETLKPSPMILSLLNFMGLGLLTGVTSALLLALIVLLLTAAGQG
ncbi:hypothetical protein [Thioflexithrix psekupsensis]|nr:hypothetical protein [Thioflexithrix psekupsensis]